jgi:hypothetical protein
MSQSGPPDLVDRFSVRCIGFGGRWIEATGEAQDALFVPMLDAHEDLRPFVTNICYANRDLN